MSTPIEIAGKAWNEARQTERKLAVDLYVAIRAYCDDGGSEVTAARLAGVDRMTVRRALYKR
jgi:hypothetical protein